MIGTTDLALKCTTAHSLHSIEKRLRERKSERVFRQRMANAEDHVTMVKKMSHSSAFPHNLNRLKRNKIKRKRTKTNEKKAIK